jgi:glycosyltransferase involved in cell wall biosynthesis
VIPVYNSRDSLEELSDRLVQTLSVIDKSYRLIFVNDASSDDSFSVLKSIKAKYSKNITLINLAKNCGQQHALMCGFNFCNAEFVVTIDDDLQNPPEELPILLSKIEMGADAVYAKYDDKKDLWYKNLGSIFIRKLNNRIFGENKTLVFSSYRIMRRSLVEEIRRSSTHYPYISGLIRSVTSNIENVDIRHHKRKYGKSNYSLPKLIELSFNLLVNYSSLPLKITSYIGLAFSLFSFIVGVFFLFKQIIIGQAPAGWTSLIVLVSFNNSLLMVLLYFFGEYISRILKELSFGRTYRISEVIE